MHAHTFARFLLLVYALSFANKMSWSGAVNSVVDSLSDDGSLSDSEDESIEPAIDDDVFNSTAAACRSGGIVSQREAARLSPSSVTAAAGFECGCLPKACSTTANLTSEGVYALRHSFLRIPTQKSARLNAVF